NKTVKIIKKAKGIYDDADYYIALFNRPDTKEQLSNLMTEGEKLLKHLKPKVFKAHLEIGREDPYDTGKILSILSIIYPFIGNGLTVEPYYDRDITDFDLLLKTRARVFTLLLIGYRVYFHKGFRRFLKALKHKER
ncbi:MAG: hypothetical protein K6G22_07525, partial [Lachnospiraceae bacterium]|nr:hypothetical protein [Lachnospiraceae bacterium]